MQVLDKFIHDTKALIFVIDAVAENSDLDLDLRDSAEYFIQILSNENLYSKTSKRDQLNILVICNKQDKKLAIPADKIKANLEREINILKKIYNQNTRSGKNLKQTSNLNNDAEEEDKIAENINQIFYSSDHDFCFEDLEHFSVEFCGVSCFDPESDFSVVDGWLENMTSVA